MTEAVSNVLRIRMLGALELEGLDIARLGSRKARSLLRALALGRGAPVPVDVIGERLWGEDLPSRPAEQIAVLVSRARGVLGAERVTRSDAGYTLHYDWLDVDTFFELVETSVDRLEAGRLAAAATSARSALALVRGSPPLEADSGWSDADRHAVERAVARLRRVGAEAALGVGDHEQAVEFAQRALDADPYDEAILLVLMAARVGEGRPAGALIAYETMRKRLHDELGVDPSPETQAAHTAVLKGDPVPGVATSPAGGRAREREGAGSLPGRAEELARLDAAFERARAGGPLVVLVEGDAGIGKTRLIDAWTASVAQSATVLRGHCDELARSLPLDAVVDAVAAFFRSQSLESAEELLGPQRAVLGPLLGISTADEASVLTYSEEAAGRAALFGALNTLFRRLADERPVVIVLDDLHLAGTTTAEWLTYLARRGRGMPVLVLGARRTDEPRAPSIASDDVIALGPLDLGAVAEVVGAERAPALYERSGGNPLFLVELAAHSGDELPATLRDAVVERCSRAGAAARTLQAAAVVGTRVDLDVLGAILDKPPMTLLDDLEEGVRRHLIQERGSHFEFRHDIIREALSSAAGFLRRSLLHREAARVLAARPGHDPMDVAYHARLGGDDERAARAFAAAARLAAYRFDYSHAEELADDSVSLLDGAEGRLERARARLALGRFSEARDDARSAFGMGAGANALEVAGWASYYLRDFTAAERFASDGARLADDPSVRASCLMLMGRIVHCAGDLPKAEGVFEEASALAKGAALPVGLTWLGVLRVHQGRCDDGLDLLDAAAHGGVMSHPFAVFHLHQATAQALGQVGRLADAFAASDRHIAEAERRSDQRYLAMARNVRAWLLRNIGAAEEADDLNRCSWEQASGFTQVEAGAWSLLDLADGSIRRGDLAGAVEQLSGFETFITPGASDPGAKGMSYRYEMRGKLHRARLLLASGENDDARGLALQIAEDAGAIGVLRYRLLAGLVAHEAQFASERSTDLGAVDEILRSLERLAGIEDWWLTARVAAWSGVERWWDRAAARVAALIPQAGPYRDTLERYAAAVFSKPRTPA
jgi:DNA-binding SARP family transcriptional activator